MSYLQELKDSLLESNLLLSLYKDKLNFLEDYNIKENKTLEVVNSKIEYLKTKKEIEVLEKIIKDKTDYFTAYSKTFEIDYSEMIKNFDTVLSKAKGKQKSSDLIDNLLKSVNWEALKNSKEGKVMLYNKLKKLV